MKIIIGTVLATTLSVAGCTYFLSPFQSMEVPPQPDAIKLGTGTLPGGHPETWFKIAGVATVRNVTEATLTPVLPAKGKATGAGVVVAPGGGFIMLSMDTEGWQVAHWLADHGIAAFVVKYRVRPTAPGTIGFLKDLGQVMSGPKQALDEAYLHKVTPEYAVEDGLAAMKLVRTRAAAWGVDPKRVGIIGFSAGAITAMQVGQRSTPEAMPAFIATIYGPMNAMHVPNAAPPLFTALAQDDPIFGKSGDGLVKAWQAAGKPVEAHLYPTGGHGFGLGKPGTETVGWPESFRKWMENNKFIEKSS